MIHRYYIAILFALFPFICLSQDEMKDGLSIENHSDSICLNTEVNPENNPPTMLFPEFLGYSPEIRPMIPDRRQHLLDMDIQDFHFTPGLASLFRWNNGGIFATGSMTQLPGMMDIDRGTLEIYQMLGNFTFNAGGAVNKYGYFNGLHSQYGLNMNVSYQFSTRLSASIFGEYYFGTPPGVERGAPMTPGMIGYYGRSSYGGFIDYKINDHWGVQTGVQTVRQVGTNKFQAEPIVTPYYRINKKVAIGLPVGQILYHILRSNR